jgi:hypothetical protein
MRELNACAKWKKSSKHANAKTNKIKVIHKFRLPLYSMPLSTLTLTGSQ